MGHLQFLEKWMLCTENRQQVRFQDAMVTVSNAGPRHSQNPTALSAFRSCPPVSGPAVKSWGHLVSCLGHAFVSLMARRGLPSSLIH